MIPEKPVGMNYPDDARWLGTLATGETLWLDFYDDGGARLVVQPVGRAAVGYQLAIILQQPDYSEFARWVAYIEANHPAICMALRLMGRVPRG